ncbi:MAG: hypothetical protein IPO87_07325 [Flavobacteriales bacterium]|nr:hypothetical protein [Flavobacteriales bacterium]
MGKLVEKQTKKRVTVRKSTPKHPKRPLPDVRKFAGTVPGMDKWALEEVKRMRDEW